MRFIFKDVAFLRIRDNDHLQKRTASKRALFSIANEHLNTFKIYGIASLNTFTLKQPDGSQVEKPPVTFRCPFLVGSR